jgi:hypothetical protein
MATSHVQNPTLGEKAHSIKYYKDFASLYGHKLGRPSVVRFFF